MIVRWFQTLVVTILATTAVSASAPPILRFDDVRPGMKGVGRTVFQGTEIVEFDVEIIGTLPDIAPDQDLILARCTGGPLADTRILSGMSGSPVFIDDKLIGAVAYSWGFSQEPIAGITPIEEMLRISALESGTVSAARVDGARAVVDLRNVLEPLPYDEFFSELLGQILGPAGATAPIAVPISISGLSSTGVARISPGFSSAGFVPMQGSAAGAADPAPGTIEPGAAVGVKLVRGDVEMTATGTVTWVDGDRVLAFGHPLFGLGTVDLPLTAARVEAILPSLMQSSRMATPTREVGALRQDRVSGILGVLEASAGMIPVRLQYADGSGGRQTFAFDVAEDPLLAPVLLYYAINGILASKDRAFGSATLRVAEGSVIQLQDEDDVTLDNLFAGREALAYATGTSAYILHLLLNNDWSPPRVAGVNLMLEYEDTPRTARVQRVTLDRYRVRAGDSVRATVVLKPFRGPDLVLDREIRIPRETPPGTLTVLVGGALAVSRPEAGQEPLWPRDLAQFVWLINQLRRNDQIFIIATREDDGVFVDGVRLPNLPPSVAGVLTRPRSRGNLTIVSQRGVLEEKIPTSYAVQGLTRMQLVVESP